MHSRDTDFSSLLFIYVESIKYFITAIFHYFLNCDQWWSYYFYVCPLCTFYRSLRIQSTNQGSKGLNSFNVLSYPRIIAKYACSTSWARHKKHLKDPWTKHMYFDSAYFIGIVVFDLRIDHGIRNDLTLLFLTWILALTWLCSALD